MLKRDLGFRVTKALSLGILCLAQRTSVPKVLGYQSPRYGPLKQDWRIQQVAPFERRANMDIYHRLHPLRYVRQCHHNIAYLHHSWTRQVRPWLFR